MARYEVIVDNEWIYEGDYDTAEQIAHNYWSDPDFWGSCSLITEEEFYGCDCADASEVYGA